MRNESHRKRKKLSEMRRYFEDEKRRYELFAVCPKCRGEIYWRSYTGPEKSKGQVVAHCQNSSLAYRNVQTILESFICEWRGKVSTDEDGDLVIENFDGTPMPYRVYIMIKDNDDTFPIHRII
jgi:hypothetical protein